MEKPLQVAKAAFAALPETVKELYYRGDSACHEQNLISWLLDEDREGGRKGCIGFAISARMSRALQQAVEAVLDAEWQGYGKADPDAIRECAEVAFVSHETYGQKHKAAQSLRHLAIRLRKRQGESFADGSTVKHFAVLTNLYEWPPANLLQWHREKGGTVEAVHHVLKNGLAAGVMPCGRFGANTAWVPLTVLTHNVLTALKRLALPPELHQTELPPGGYSRDELVGAEELSRASHRSGLLRGHVLRTETEAAYPLRKAADHLAEVFRDSALPLLRFGRRNPQDSLSNDPVAAPTTCRYSPIRTTPWMGHLKSFGETPVGMFG